MTIIVTGGAGFIGSNFVQDWLAQSDETVVNLDKFTYAANLDNLATLEGDARHVLVRGDIADSDLIAHLLREYRPRAILNFAAESHVDRSIHGPSEFIQTNIVGTYRLLECARAYWDAMPSSERPSFRFLQVSTDEVYGSLGPAAPAFSEANRYEPSSPYSASKAAGDHLVRAWHQTYGLPAVITNCSNNYGPLQFPEKLVPLMIINALAGKPLPLYGDGQNVRDWLYVKDHCSAVRRVLDAGVPGETYNIGGWNEKTNIAIVQDICDWLDRLRPKRGGGSYASQITFVKDRAGHDRRYAIDATKIKAELGWMPSETFESGIRKTIVWYLENESWVESTQTGQYREWVARQYEMAP